MANELVSVVIPAFNREAVIGRALKSALRQTYDNLEIIVVDDASSDNTLGVVESFQDARIVYLRHETNRFAAAARNTAMRVARGKYIAFLDSDDEWLPNKIEQQVTKLQSLGDEWGCIYTGAYVFKDDAKSGSLYSPVLNGHILAPFLLKKTTIFTPTFAFRREVLDTIGLMDESLRRCQDLDFYIRILERYKVAVIPEPTTNIYLDTIKPLSSAGVASKRALLEKHKQKIDALGFWNSRRLYSAEEYLLAKLALNEGRLMSGLSSWLKSVWLNPLQKPQRHLSITYSALLGLRRRIKRQATT